MKKVLTCTLFLWTGVFITALLYCTPGRKISETDRLNQWFAQKWERDLMDSPEFLTAIGRKERMSELDDDSEEKALQRLEEKKKDLREIVFFDTSLLDKQAKLSLVLYKNRLEETVGLEEFRHYNYPESQMGGVHQDLPSFMINMHAIKNEQDAHAYISRLYAFSKKFQQVIDNLKIREEKGIIAPRFVFPLVVESCRNVLGDTAKLDSNLLIKDFRKKTDSLNLDNMQKNALIQEAKFALKTHVIPAYFSLIDFCGELEKKADDTVGIWKLRNGDSAYKALLKHTTTTDLSPEEIFNIGMTEVNRIHNEIRKIMTQVAFKGSLQEFFKFMAVDEQFYYKDSRQEKEMLVTDYQTILDSMYGKLPEMFVAIPKARLIVRTVEPYREMGAPEAFYEMPAPDGSRPGMFYVNTFKIRDNPKYEMEALAFHEGIPGHHLQISLSQELKNVPEFRKYLWYTAYGEGWALYAESLGKEMGFYKDPYSDFGRLSMELWRACRLVVDAGIHYKRWTREQATQYLVDNTPSSQTACLKAIDRYIVWPGQATAYTIGMKEILRLRGKAQKELGEKFDIRTFHDIVLQTGCVPLSLLAERVNDWINE